MQRARSRFAGLAALVFLSLAISSPPFFVPEALAAAGNATGKPSIASGTIALSGSEATATRGNVEDPDGMDGSTLSYTWLRCDSNGNDCSAEIATGPSYTLSDDDVGLRLRLRVDFTDDGGSSESLTSYPWPSRTDNPIAAAPGSGNATGNPVIVGNLTPGNLVYPNHRAISDPDGIPANNSMYYTWWRCDAAGEACNIIEIPSERAHVSYRVTDADRGYRLKARVNFVDGAGNLEAVMTPLAPPLHEGTIGANATGQPRISGQPHVGATVAGSRGNVRDSDGIDNGTVTFTWLRCNANGYGCSTELATGPNYTLTGADVGKRLRIRLRFRDNNGGTEIRTSGPWPSRSGDPISTAPYATSREVFRDRLDLVFDQDLNTDAIPPASAFAVNVSGQAVAVREVSRVGARIVRLALERRVTPDGTVTVSYTRPAESGRRIQNGDGEPAKSFADSNVENVTPVNEAATGAPAISGTATVGGTLAAGRGTIADPNGLNSPGYSYRWIRVGEDGEADISGARGSAYTVSEDDIGSRLKVRAAFEDDALYPEARTSEATAVVADTVGPRLVDGGASVDGAALTLQFDEPLDAASRPAASAFSVSAAGSPVSVSSVAVSGATVTLTLAGAVSRGQTVTLDYAAPASDPIRDTLGNAAGNLAAVDVDNLTPSVPGAPRIEVVIPADTEIVLKLHAPADNGGLEITGYQYRSAEGASVPEDTAWTDAAATTVMVAGLRRYVVTVTGLRNGATYAVEVRAANRIGGGAATSTAAYTTSSSRNATGRPAISDDSVARRGYRATAALGDVSDPDGFDAARLVYTWLRCDANGNSCDNEIGTGSSYALTRDDVGLRIRVRAEFIDDVGTFEALTSFPWPSRSDPPIGTAPVTVGLRALQDRLYVVYDQELRADAVPPASAFAVNAGGQSVAVDRVAMHHTQSVRLTLARRVTPGETVTLGYTQPSSVGNRIQNADAAAAPPFSGRSVTNITPVNRAATGAPEISGTAAVGGTLTASRGTIADANGLRNAVFEYQWIRVDDGGEADISGATGSTYRVSEDDAGSRLKVRVAFEDEGRYPEARTSEATAVVADTVGPRLVDGGASVDGAALTLQFDEPLDAASRPAASAFSVSAAGSPVSVSSVAMNGATVTLTLAGAVSRGQTVTLDYAAPAAGPIRDALGNEARDLASETVVNLTPSVPGAPTIEVATIADTEVVLTLRAPADDGGADTPVYEYRFAEGASVPEEMAWTGAAGTTVTFTGLRNGTGYAIEARATNRLGAGPVASTAVTTTSISRNATGGPSVSGDSIARRGYRATATPGDVEDPDGFDAETLSYTWLRCDANGGNCNTEIGTGGSYMLSDDDVGLRLRLRLDYVDDAGTFETLMSSAWPSLPGEPVGMPPALAAQRVLRDRLDLIFDRNLGNFRPPASAFAVAVNGEAVAVDGVRFSGVRALRLQLERPVTPDEAVTVGYTRPSGQGAQEIRDFEGVPAESFADRNVENVTPLNQAATGAPAISGTAAVGGTLAAGRGTIADPNGLNSPGYSYRWIRVGEDGEADISGASGSAYTVSEDDIGSRLKVRAAFEDDALYPEARTSEATAVVADTVGPRLVDGGASVDGAALTLQFDEPLDAAPAPAASAFSVSAAGSPVSVSSVAVSGATVTLTLASAVGRGEAVTLDYAAPATDPIRDAHGNAAGNLPAVDVDNLTPSVPGAPRIEVATPADTEIVLRFYAPADNGGLEITSYQYRFAEGASVPEDTAWTDQPNTFRVRFADLRSGTTYSFEARALNRLGAGPATRESATTPGLTDHPATGAPTIAGTVAVRQTLTASTTAIADANGVGDYRYQWVRLDGAVSEDIPEALSGAYKVRLEDIGKQLAVRVEFTDDDGFDEALTSAATAAVPDAENAPPTSKDITVEVVEDGEALIQLSSLHFADEDYGHELTGVRLESLPDDGVLEYLDNSQSTAVPATAGMEIAGDDLHFGSLVFRPAANSHGSAYASFAFKVHDGIGYSAGSYRMTIDVSPAPDAPVGAPEIGGRAKRGETLTAILDGISDPDGLENADYEYRWIRIVETYGLRETIAGADAGSYTPVDADVGAQVAVEVTFTDDGGSEHVLTSVAYPAEGAIAGNDPPTSADSTVETDEDAAYRFAASDFPFSDSDGGSLASVRIETLPASGALTFDGADVTARQVVVVSDLDRGKLHYTPAANANGDGLASFSFWVNDGESDSEAGYAMTVDVAPVNDAPEATDSVATAVEDTAYAFGASDFGFVDIDGDNLASVTIATLPAKGSLTVPGANAGDPPVAVVANQAISRASLNGGELTFTPAANENGSSYASFTFKVSDGTAESAASGRLTIDVAAVDDAPGAADSAVTTSEGVPYAFSLEDFNFTDVDGDRLESVTVETLPARGTLYRRAALFDAGTTIPAVEISAGEFTFLPEGSASGSAYASFTFRVRTGNRASAADYTMTIDVTGTDDPATGFAAITGKAVVGRTLTADTSLIDDPDGLTEPNFTYSWSRVDGENEKNVGTGTGYTVTADDLGATVRLTVEFTDDGGTTTRMEAVTEFVVNNGAPEAYGGFVSLDEDTSYAFGYYDFSFWDPDNDPLTDVTIVSLPATDKGLLTLDGDGPDDSPVAVTAGQAIPVGDIEAGKLKYTPPANANGGYEEYASFAYKVSDGLAESGSADLSVNVYPVDDPATGAPAITGTLEVGEELVADTTGIDDPDGLTNPGFTYDWNRVDEEGSITGFAGSGSTYTITLDDVGSRLRVLVRFSDDAFGYGELWSAASDAVQRSAASNNAPVSQDRTVTIDEDFAYSFTETDFQFSDEDAIDSLVSVIVASLPGVGTLTLDAEDPAGDTAPVSAGDAIPAADILASRLKFTPAANGNGEPYASFAFKVTDGISESAGYTMTVNVSAVDDPNSMSGSPVISGTAEIGETLTADIAGIADIDGLNDASEPEYQWFRMHEGEESEIFGATGRSYTLTGEDIGKEIKVRVTVFDIYFESGELFSAPVAVAGNVAPTGADRTVTTAEDTGYAFATGDFGYSDADSDALASVEVVTLPTVGLLNLDGAALSATDLPKTVTKAEIDRDGLTWTPPANAHGAGLASFTFRVNDGIVWSEASNRITIDVTAVNDPAGGLAISGTARVGLTLEADLSAIGDPDGISAPGYRYRWVRVAGGGAETGLGTASSYLLVSADAGNTVRLEVSLTDDDGNRQTLTAETGTVAANAAPTGADRTVTTAKNRSYVFARSDFGFSDGDGDTLAGVRIVTLPAEGRGGLTLDGAAVEADDVVRARSIRAGDLAYAPPANAHGAGLASFTFKVGDGIFESAAANTITIDVTALPGVPTGIGSTRGDRSVALAWAAPADTGSSAIEKYQYRVSENGGASWVIGWTDVPDGDDEGAGLHDETGYTVKGLRKGTEHRFELRAVNGVGVGAVAWLEATPATAPGAPTGFHATGGIEEADLTWTAPSQTGGLAIEKYQYRASKNGGASWVIGWTDVPDGDDEGADLHDESSFTAPNLEDNTAYAIELRAVNAAGSGAAARAAARTLSTLPLTLGVIAGDDRVNIAEKAAGFPVAGTTGGVSGASVTANVGGTELTTTSGPDGAWAVRVPQNAGYIAGESVSVTVSAAKQGYSDAETATRSLDVDLAAPVVGSATVDGTSLTITFGERLGAAASLANTAFSVVKSPAGGGEQTIALSAGDAPVVSGDTVTLTLAAGVTSTDSNIEVGYTKPANGSSNKLADGFDNEVASFAGQAVTNGTPDPSPALTSAALDGSALTLTFSGTLDASRGGVPAVSAFAVTVTGSGRAPTSATMSAKPSIDGRTVTLNLGAAPATGASVTVAYTMPGSGGRLRSYRSKTEVETFSAREATRSNPVAGTPAITAPNVFQVPAKLGVDMSSVTGAGDLGDLSYRWIRVDADGASNPVNIGTGETYRLVDADAGKKIKVEVSYRGAQGNSGTLGSAAYPSRSNVRSRGTCNAPTLSGGAELVGSGRTLSVGAYSHRDGDAWGYYNGREIEFGELDDATFSIDGTDYELKAVASADNEDGEAMYVLLDKDLSADHRRTLTLHDCGWTYAFDNATKHDVHAQYRWPLVLRMSGSAERTLYLSRDAAAPTVSSATVHNASLTVTFSEELGAAASLSNAAFSVVRTPEGGSEETVALSADHAPFIDGATVTLMLASAAASTDSDIEVSYTVPGSGSENRLADRFGNEVAGFAGRAVSHGTASAIPGLSVADAQVREGAGAKLVFTVSLDSARQTHVRVDYATRDGTAVAGADYFGRSGTLFFARGQTRKTVEVRVVDDVHDEGSETMTFALSNARGTRIADGEATGTIVNTDPIPQAWIARFGRTVADQVLEAVEERVEASRQPGAEVSLGGERIGFGARRDAPAANAQEAEAQRAAADVTAWLRGTTDPEAGRADAAQTMSQRGLLLGSSFSVTAGMEGKGLVSFWGRGAVTRFDGREKTLSLDGEVTSAMMGADWRQDRSTVGLVLSHSMGEGGYRDGADGDDPGSGAIEASLTGLYPWLSHALTDRLEAWGAAGYGEGSLTLKMKKPDEPEEPAIRTDMDLWMAAAGLRGTLVDPGSGSGTGGGEGLTLTGKADAVIVGTSTDAVTGAGNLAAADAEVTRLRLGLEGALATSLADGSVLTPGFELAIRHDGGDAETGFGADMGASLAWVDPKRGLSAELRGRGLLTHEANGFRERGLSGAFAWEPVSGDRGPRLSITQTLGGASSGGAETLFSRTTLEGLAANDNGDDLRSRLLEARFGYGFAAFGNRFTFAPEAGVGLSSAGRDISLGSRLAPQTEAGGAGSLELSVEMRRRDSANGNTPPEHEVGLRFRVRF